MRIHQDIWVKAIDTSVEAFIPTYPIVVHGVAIKSIHLDEKKKKAATIKKWQVENTSIFQGHTIKDIRWLGRPREGQRDASLILQFESPVGANAAIHAGSLYWDNTLKRTERYEKDCQIKRCYRCNGYGHIGTHCDKPETCGHCASQHHITKECPDSAAEPKCANCKGAHKAWSRLCKHYCLENERAQKARAQLQTQKYWPEPVKVSPGPSQISSAKSSQNSTQNSAQNSTQTPLEQGPARSTSHIPLPRLLKRRSEQSPTRQTGDKPKRRTLMPKASRGRPRKSKEAATTSNDKVPAAPDIIDITAAESEVEIDTGSQLSRTSNSSKSSSSSSSESQLSNASQGSQDRCLRSQKKLDQL
jgi:hypothetical protein